MSIWKRQPVQREQRGRGKPYTGPPRMCWGCGQNGHNKIDCPTTPWQQPPRGERGRVGGSPASTDTELVSVPVNPWGGPKQGY